jgi:hypothetical protein
VRDDLLDAQACVDWAIAQFPALEGRTNFWLSANVKVEIEDTGPDVPNHVIVTVQREELPRSFNVEIGTYLNTIRSSLDILASALASRYGICKPEDAYFPIARSEAAFLAKDSKAAKFVARLPPADRLRTEALKPYSGGNENLWSLHQLDIMRKSTTAPTWPRWSKRMTRYRSGLKKWVKNFWHPAPGPPCRNMTGSPSAGPYSSQ